MNQEKFVKDPNSGTVINIDDNEYAAFKLKREAARRALEMQSDIKKILEELSSIQLELKEIRNRLN